MAKEISENTVIGLSLKSISAIAVGVGILVIGYFDLQAGIAEAKLLPPPEVGRMEYDLKDQLIRETPSAVPIRPLISIVPVPAAKS